MGKKINALYKLYYTDENMYKRLSTERQKVLFNTILFNKHPLTYDDLNGSDIDDIRDCIDIILNIRHRNNISLRLNQNARKSLPILKKMDDERLIIWFSDTNIYDIDLSILSSKIIMSFRDYFSAWFFIDEMIKRGNVNKEIFVTVKPDNRRCSSELLSDEWKIKLKKQLDVNTTFKPYNIYED